MPAAKGQNGFQVCVFFPGLHIIYPYYRTREYSYSMYLHSDKEDNGIYIFGRFINKKALSIVKWCRDRWPAPGVTPVLPLVSSSGVVL